MHCSFRHYRGFHNFWAISLRTLFFSDRLACCQHYIIMRACWGIEYPVLKTESTGVRYSVFNTRYSILGVCVPSHYEVADDQPLHQPLDQHTLPINSTLYKHKADVCSTKIAWTWRQVVAYEAYNHRIHVTVTLRITRELARTQVWPMISNRLRIAWRWSQAGEREGEDSQEQSLAHVIQDRNMTTTVMYPIYIVL